MKSISEDPLSKEVPVETVLVYFNLMHTDDDPEMVQIHEEVKEYLSDVASYQNNNLYPTDLTRPSCPLTKLNGEWVHAWWIEQTYSATFLTMFK